jgi:hypothetical protein
VVAPIDRETIEPHTLVFGWNLQIQTMMQIYASAAKLRSSGAHSLIRHEAMFDREQPLPRIVVGASSLSSARAPSGGTIVTRSSASGPPIAYPAGLSLKPFGTKPVFT